MLQLSKACNSTGPDYPSERVTGVVNEFQGNEKDVVEWPDLNLISFAQFFHLQLGLHF